MRSLWRVRDAVLGVPESWRSFPFAHGPENVNNSGGLWLEVVLVVPVVIALVWWVRQ